MLKKNFVIHTMVGGLCLLASMPLCSVLLCSVAVAQNQTRPQTQPSNAPPTNAQQPGAQQPGAPAGTRVQGKQLQQMFQAQSAQNQAQAMQRGIYSQGQTPGQVPSQQVPSQQAPGQQVPGQQAPGQIPGQPGQPNTGLQPGQVSAGQGAVYGQAQSAAMQANSGQNPGQKPTPTPLTPEQAAAVAAAQQQAIAGGGINPVPPFEPLNKAWQDFLDKVLTKWEAESSKVEKFQCEFQRFQYDPTVVATEHYTFARGELKYLKPDKGLLKVNSLVLYEGKDDKGQPKYGVNAKREFGEYWMCDGQNVYDMNRNDKICTILELPPNQRGAAIQSSPLPFVFGVKKQDLMARYWIKPLPQPKDRPNEIWLEVYPRRADDAVNYQKLQVVLDLKDWMPMGLIVFLNNWTPNEPHRELYQFEKRVVNATNILPAIFQKEFIPAKPPADWKVIEHKYQEPQAEQPADQPRVAAPPQQSNAPILK